MTLSFSPAADAVPDRFARSCVLAGLMLPRPSLALATALDGSSSAKRDGQWLAGCSVPRRAAEQMIRQEKWAARSLCLIAPTHGQQIRVLLDRLGPTRALVAIVPSPNDLADILASVDLLPDLAAGRLHVAWDEASLKAIFDRHQDLAVPQQMVRLPDRDIETAKPVIAWAQAVLAPITVDHGRRLSIAGQSPAGTGRCVIGAGEFRLWNDSGHALATAFDAILNTADPLTSSEAAVAEAVVTAKVVVADRPRPAWLRAGRAWITWQTKPAIAPFNAAHRNDGLVLADASWRPLADAAGWPASRVAVANWPTPAIQFTPGAAPALLLDLPNLDVPKDCEDVTSRRLVWEAIRDELKRDPFAVGDDAAKYVARALPRLGLPTEADFPVDRYVTTLVAPAFAIGIARWLAQQNVPFTLHGRGWQEFDDLADCWKGPVADRAAFHAIVTAAGGNIDASLPTPNAAAAALGVPLVTAFRQTPQRVLQTIGSLRGGRLPVSKPATPSIREAVESLTPLHV